MNNKKTNDILSQEIDYLNLSKHLKNYLVNNLGILTINDLVNYKVKDMLSKENMKIESISKISEELTKFGYCLDFDGATQDEILRLINFSEEKLARNREILTCLTEADLETISKAEKFDWKNYTPYQREILMQNISTLKLISKENLAALGEFGFVFIEDLIKNGIVTFNSEKLKKVLKRQTAKYGLKIIGGDPKIFLEVASEIKDNATKTIESHSELLKLYNYKLKVAMQNSEAKNRKLQENSVKNNDNHAQKSENLVFEDIFNMIEKSNSIANTISGLPKKFFIYGSRYNNMLKEVIEKYIELKVEKIKKLDGTLYIKEYENLEREIKAYEELLKQKSEIRNADGFSNQVKAINVKYHHSETGFINTEVARNLGRVKPKLNLIVLGELEPYSK